MLIPTPTSDDEILSKVKFSAPPTSSPPTLPDVIDCEHVLPTPPPNKVGGMLQQSSTQELLSSPVQMNKTELALVNMLSSQLGNSNANNGTPMPMQMADVTTQSVEPPSAAGTLRLMTAQHNSFAATTTISDCANITADCSRT